jgi:hypothetical protein
MDWSDHCLTGDQNIRVPMKNNRYPRVLFVSNSQGTAAGLVDNERYSNRAKILILQSGIIEAALRILPPKVRELMGVLPGGGILTKFIYARRGQWLNLLAKLNIQFVEVGLEEYINCIKSIHANCVRDKIDLVLIEIPQLSDQFERDVLIGNNAVLSKYNDALKKISRELNIPIIDPFQGNTDPSRNSLYLLNSVHFTTFGHQLIAQNIMAFLSSYLEYQS